MPRPDFSEPAAMSFLRPLFLVLIVAASGPAQARVLFDEGRWVDAPLRLRLPETERPGLLLVEGGGAARATSDAGDLRLRLGGGISRRLRGRETGAETCRTWVEVPRAAPRTLEVLPIGGGLVLERITWWDATRLRIEVWQRSPRRLVPARVAIEAMDGSEPPSFGRRPAAGWWERTRICPRGTGEALLPAGARVTFSAAATCLHRGETRQVRIVTGTKQTVRFVLEALPRPAASVLVAPPALQSWDLTANEIEPIDAALGIGLRDSRPPVMDSAAAAHDPRAFVARLLDASRAAPVLRAGTASDPFPRALRPLMSLRLPAGALLYTNGPLLRLDPLLRRRHETRGSVAFGDLHVDHGEEVVGGRLQIHAADRKVLDAPAARGDVIPLELSHARGTRLVALFRAARFAGADVLQPPPLCFRAFVVP